jgi:hypothetical protein
MVIRNNPARSLKSIELRALNIHLDQGGNERWERLVKRNALHHRSPACRETAGLAPFRGKTQLGGSGGHATRPKHNLLNGSRGRRDEASQPSKIALVRLESSYCLHGKARPKKSGNRVAIVRTTIN